MAPSEKKRASQQNEVNRKKFNQIKRRGEIVKKILPLPPFRFPMSKKSITTSRNLVIRTVATRSKVIRRKIASSMRLMES